MEGIKSQQVDCVRDVKPSKLLLKESGRNCLSVKETGYLHNSFQRVYTTRRDF